MQQDDKKTNVATKHEITKTKQSKNLNLCGISTYFREK